MAHWKAWSGKRINNHAYHASGNNQGTCSVTGIFIMFQSEEWLLGLLWYFALNSVDPFCLCNIKPVDILGNAWVDRTNSFVDIFQFYQERVLLTILTLTHSLKKKSYTIRYLYSFVLFLSKNDYLKRWLFFLATGFSSLCASWIQFGTRTNRSSQSRATTNWKKWGRCWPSRWYSVPQDDKNAKQLSTVLTPTLFFCWIQATIKLRNRLTTLSIAWKSD